MKNTFAKFMAIALVFVSFVSVFPQNALAGCKHTRVCDTNYCMLCYETYAGSSVYHINPIWQTDGTYHWGYCPDCGATINKGKHQRYCTGDMYCFTCYSTYSGSNILHTSLRTANGESYCRECGYYKKKTTTPSNGSNGNNSNNGSYGNSSSYGNNGYNGGNQYANTPAPYNTVQFGSFEQDSNMYNGQEPIEWYVIYSDQQKALLLSRFALINKQFNSSYTNITWENSSIRTWLNNDFYYSAFTYPEKTLILTNERGYTLQSGGYGEIITADDVFLLSLSEVNYYLGGPTSRLATPTTYARSRGTAVSNGYCWWWLRTNGDSNKIAQFVFENGNTCSMGRDVSRYEGGVRPAIWVDASVIR